MDEINLMEVSLSINDLDDDVLLIIFSLLDFTDKVRIERVCRRWKHLVTYLLSMQTCLYFSDKNHFDIELCCPSAPVDVKPTDLIQLSKSKESLQFLQLLGENQLESWDSVGIKIIRGAINKCPNLKKIGLMDFLRLENPLLLISENCDTSLESIDLIGFRRISFAVDSVKQIANKFSSLKSLRAVSTSMAIAEESLRLIFQGCQNLQELTLHSNVVYPPSWTEWGRFGAYQRINGECYNFLSDKIKEINTDTRILDNSGLLALAAGNAAKSLTTLDLSGSTWDSWWLQIICQGLKQLQRLRCSKISVFSQDDLEDVALISELKNLQELFLHLSSKSCILYFDDALFSILQGCPNMQKLQLFNILVTDRSLVHINRYWPQLHHLSFHTQINPNITDACVSSIAQLKNLQSLNLNGTSVGDGVIDVIRFCDQLKDLNLEYTLISNLTVAALINIAIKRPNIKITVNIGGTDTHVPNDIPSNLKFLNNKTIE